MESTANRVDILDLGLDLDLRVIDPINSINSNIASSQGGSPDSPNFVFDRKERSLSFCCTPL